MNEHQYEIYYGDAFNIARAGADWTIWRLVDDNGKRETITLTAAGMDELRDYFASYYAEDRGAA